MASFPVMLQPLQSIPLLGEEVVVLSPILSAPVGDEMAALPGRSNGIYGNYQSSESVLELYRFSGNDFDNISQT
jgi:hypothetical protein